MPILVKLILSAFVIAVVGIVIVTVGSDPCTDVANIFLKQLKEGESSSIVNLMGENTCHCQPRGGYIAYFKYESGENDNMAYLFKHPFKTGDMSVKAVPTVEKIKGGHLPWEKPESTEVDMPITFDKESYSPVFIPMDMAFGIPVKQEVIESFAKDPSKDFARDLTIRLRPSLAKGLIPPVQPKDPKKEAEYMADLYLEMLPPEEAKYVKPTDAADVITADGKAHPASEFEKLLPHLKRATLRLYMGRRGVLQRWAVKKARLKDPVFELADGKDMALTSPEAALMDVPGHVLGDGAEEPKADHK